MNTPTTTGRVHYDEHLGPVYTWMAGGFEAAIARGSAEIADLGAKAAAGGVAVDLGAGFGTHAFALARNGYRVIAVDTCPLLLQALAERRGGLPIEVVEADLRSFRRHLEDRATLVLCMGDTLTHLGDKRSVRVLIRDIADALESGGHFVTTFRDYTQALSGRDRFVPVRGDAGRILTCFLEYTPTRVRVHDILHERDGDAWRVRVSAYPKLRLAPEWVAEQLQVHGFAVAWDSGPGGMVRLTARRR